MANANRGNAQVERQAMMAGNDPAVGIALRQFFRPYVLAFVALAVAFGGFSYGYKLAQYLQHPEVTRATLTRAWLEDRSASVAVVSHAHADPGKLLGLALVAAALLRMAHRTPDIFFDEAAPAREAFYSSSLIPFRAPPISNPSLA
jgi:hypothetical protein